MDAMLISIVLTGLGLGMLHALDPDHVAAVMGSSAPGLKRETEGRLMPVLRFGLHWAFGHGAAVVIVSLLVLLLGMATPVKLSMWAETAVGYTLVAIALAGFWRIYHQWRHHLPGKRVTGLAPLVGLLHGLAGSAPLLALVPLSQLQQPILGIAYVMLFSLGVAAGMLALLSLCGCVAHYALGQRPIGFLVLQSFMAGFSLLVGMVLISGIAW